jgi:hypothetical protein
MKRNAKYMSLGIWVMWGLLVLCCRAADAGQLQAGAAKVDITPAHDQLPAGFSSVLDHIYTRAIFVSDGKNNVLLINTDLGKLTTPYYQRVVAHITQATGVPEDNIILSAIHGHESPTQITNGVRPRGQLGWDEHSRVFADNLDKALVEVAVKAKAAAQPAKMGFGTGNLYLNVNRDAIDTKTRLWKQDYNLDYPSDKTLAVLQFVKTNGEPIAVYMNYAMHAVSLYLHGYISADFPGAASDYIERVYGKGMVAVWTSGAAGDQNPLYQRASHLITNARIENEMTVPPSDDPTGAENGKALRRVWTGTNVKPLLEGDSQTEAMSQSMMRAMGQIMAEQTIEVMQNTKRFLSDVTIQSATQTLNCPGRTRIDNGREGYPGQYKDGDPIDFRLGAVRIGDVALGAINAELYSMIGQRLKQESPFNFTMLVTVANGQSNSGYVPTDDAFGRYTFEVLGTQLQPGCAERGIVEGIDGLMEKELNQPTEKQ